MIIRCIYIDPSGNGPTPDSKIASIGASIGGAIVGIIMVIAGTYLLLMCCILYTILVVLFGIACYYKNKKKVGSKENSGKL